MDPIYDLRADESVLRGVDPLARAKARMESGEEAEARAEQKRIDSKRDEIRRGLQIQEMANRSQLYRQGFLDSEVAAIAQQAQQRKLARAGELRAELSKLTSQEAWQPPGADRVAEKQREYEAHRAGQADWDRGSCMRMRQWSLEVQLARERGVAPPPRSSAGGGAAPLPPGWIARSDVVRLADADW